MAQLSSLAEAKQAIDAAAARVNQPEQAAQLFNVPETLASLREGIAFVESELRREVSSGREDLLSQARAIHTMEAELATIKAGAERLGAMVARVNQDLSTPQRQMQVAVNQLRRLHEASELLRSVQHFLWLCKRLGGYMDVPGDIEGTELEKAAACVFELEELRDLKRKELAVIPVAQAEMARADALAAKLRARAQSLLFRAVTQRKQTQAANALQAFFNLGPAALSRAVEGVVSRSTQKAHEIVISALDPNVLSAEMKAAAIAAEDKGSTTRGGTAAASLKVVNIVGGMLDNVLLSCAELLHVQVVLDKKRDPLSGRTLAYHLDQVTSSASQTDIAGTTIFASFWDPLSALVGERLGLVFSGSRSVRQVFVSSFPQHIGQFKNFLAQLQLQHHTLSTAAEETASGASGASGIQFLTSNEQQSFLSGLASLRGDFKASFSARCEDAVAAAFSGQHGVPTSSEVGALCALLEGELTQAGADAALLQLAVDTAVETVQQFCSMISQTMGSSADAFQLSGHVNNTQMLDVHRFNAMSAMHWHIGNTMRSALLAANKALADQNRTSTPSSSNRQYAVYSGGMAHDGTDENNGVSSGAAQLALLEALESEVKAACSELVTPLFSSMRAALEAKIFAVHKQKFGETARGALASEIQGSEYMSEFAKQAGMIAKLLSRYDAANPVIKAHTVELIDQLVTYATRHLSLVGTYRSIPEEHLHLLATDVAQFTLAMSGLTSLKIPELAKARHACSAFKELLFYDHTLMVANASKLTALSIVTVVDFAFTRAPPDVVHPYTVRGEDLETYSQKLDEQSDEALWTASQAYLQRHAKAVGRNPELAKGCRAVLDVGLAIEAAKAADIDAAAGNET